MLNIESHWGQFHNNDDAIKLTLTYIRLYKYIHVTYEYGGFT